MQRRSAFWIVLVFTAFCSVGLANVSFWFARERWGFSEFRKQQKINMNSDDFSLWDWIKYQYRNLRLRKEEHLFTDSEGFFLSRRRRSSSPEADDSTLPERMRRRLIAIKEFFAFARPSKPPHFRHDSTNSAASRDEERKKGVRRPSNNRIINSAGRMQSDPWMMSPIRSLSETNRSYADEFAKNLKSLQVQQLGPGLHRVKHMQFSPDGKWLVVCYRFLCHVYDVRVRGSFLAPSYVEFHTLTDRIFTCRITSSCTET